MKYFIIYTSFLSFCHLSPYSLLGQLEKLLLFPKVVLVATVCCSHSRHLAITAALRFPFVRIYNLHALWSAFTYQTFYKLSIFNVKLKSTAEIFRFMPTVSVYCSFTHCHCSPFYFLLDCLNYTTFKPALQAFLCERKNIFFLLIYIIMYDSTWPLTIYNILFFCSKLSWK